MKSILLIIFGAILLSLKSYAQDPFFFNIDQARSFYHPSYVALPRALEINTSLKNQWPKIPGGFRTAYFGLNYQPCNYFMGFGVYGMLDDKGVGGLKTQMYGVSLRWLIPIKKSFIDHVAIAFPFEYYSKSLNNQDELVFSNEIDQVTGITNNNLNPQLLNSGVSFFSSGLSATFKGEFSNVLQKDAPFSVSATFNHFGSQHEKSLQNDNYLLNLPEFSCYTFSMSLEDKSQTITPRISMQYQKQSKIEKITSGGILDFSQENDKASFAIGVYYSTQIRSSNNVKCVSLCPQLQFPITEGTLASFCLSYVVGYNNNTTNLPATGAGSIVEATLNLYFLGCNGVFKTPSIYRQKNIINKNQCPRFGKASF